MYITTETWGDHSRYFILIFKSNICVNHPFFLFVLFSIFNPHRMRTPVNITQPLQVNCTQPIFQLFHIFLYEIYSPLIFMKMWYQFFFFIIIFIFYSYFRMNSNINICYLYHPKTYNFKLKYFVMLIHYFIELLIMFRHKGDFDKRAQEPIRIIWINSFQTRLLS